MKIYRWNDIRKGAFNLVIDGVVYSIVERTSSEHYKGKSIIGYKRPNGDKLFVGVLDLETEAFTT